MVKISLEYTKSYIETDMYRRFSKNEVACTGACMVLEISVRVLHVFYMYFERHLKIIEI